MITEWKYPGEYAVYDSTPYEEQKKEALGFANPANHFYSFYDETALVGLSIYTKRKQKSFRNRRKILTAAAKAMGSR